MGKLDLNQFKYSSKQKLITHRKEFNLHFWQVIFRQLGGYQNRAIKNDLLYY